MDVVIHKDEKFWLDNLILIPEEILKTGIRFAFMIPVKIFFLNGTTISKTSKKSVGLKKKENIPTLS